MLPGRRGLGRRGRDRTRRQVPARALRVPPGRRGRPDRAWVAERLVEGRSTTSSRRAAWRRSTWEPTRSGCSSARVGPTATLTELARDMVITRLGQGVDATGRIAPDALARTDRGARRYCRRARALGAERIRLAATSAVRDAANREELAAAVREHAGSGWRSSPASSEARAVVPWRRRAGSIPTAAPPPYLVLDIGGGSTEFVIGSRPGEPDACGLDPDGKRPADGALRPHRPAGARGPRGARATAVDDVLARGGARVPAGDARTLVAVAGTATTLQAIALGLTRYDPDAIHRTWLAADDVERIAPRTSRG